LNATDREANISNFDAAGTRSSDGQQGLNSASSQPTSSNGAAPNNLLRKMNTRGLLLIAIILV
jgi:hypothetical protein